MSSPELTKRVVNRSSLTAKLDRGSAREGAKNANAKLSLLFAASRLRVRLPGLRRRLARVLEFRKMMQTGQGSELCKIPNPKIPNAKEIPTQKSQVTSG